MFLQFFSHFIHSTLLLIVSTRFQIWILNLLIVSKLKPLNQQDMMIVFMLLLSQTYGKKYYFVNIDYNCDFKLKKLIT